MIYIHIYINNFEILTWICVDYILISVTREILKRPYIWSMKHNVEKSR
jgi:hypothetical protein